MCVSFCEGDERVGLEAIYGCHFFYAPFSKLKKKARNVHYFIKGSTAVVSLARLGLLLEVLT